MLARTRERGDTLIEVIFATAVLALIIVISLSIMNAGTAQAERAVEQTFVRQEIDSQSEMLRFARDSYVDKDPGAADLWGKITDQRVDTVLPFGQLASVCSPAGNGQKGFWLAPAGSSLTLQTSYAAPATYAHAGQGVWIEATNDTTDANYLDFYIYACWSSPGSGPNATTGTIVRLYAPAQ